MESRPDTEIKTHVEAELRSCPNIDESRITVRVQGGLVTLSGSVRNLFHKYGAEDAVKRIAGVSGVSNVLRVRADTH
ncbi:MAG: BON domain-containing protein [Gammaproteobacteria bacterium]|nr:BON domain-containing protein [Gammaproteobacteria bacterium]MBV8495462.1 BON domain-containing protein [Gammaproteobacteria bacterium]